MKNIKINKERLHRLYMKEVHRISGLFEDRSNFTAEELIGIVSNVLEKNPDLIEEKKPRL
jgi:hypothetical protein